MFITLTPGRFHADTFRSPRAVVEVVVFVVVVVVVIVVDELDINIDCSASVLEHYSTLMKLFLVGVFCAIFLFFLQHNENMDASDWLEE